MQIFIGLCLATVLFRLAWVDLQSHRLPDAWTLPLIAAGPGLALMGGGLELWSSVLGGAIGYGLFWGIGAIYFRQNGREGLGLGDAKLFAAAGTWVGVFLLPYVLLVACAAGLVQAGVQRKYLARGIAFGPALAFGFWIVWVAQATGVIAPSF